ncbi:SUMO-activating enzyme subunit 1 [Copidosoma floridanum]|uniref:SUMO-activating enzyme subunit 1 n=1 Tax=Copidosoma floridanum TaxID=29053 RepID=UPI0006C9CC18|nr:SUMO-activating enzyme subunit 1 [Copidosoma floridanum]
MVDLDYSKELTEDEAALYDRQIRLWGLESQKRLRAASVLLAGLNGYHAEVAKNIILAGVKSVTFLDHRSVTDLDACNQFFIPSTEVGKNRAEASVQRAESLNSMVNVIADPANIDDKSEEYFKDFDVVCVSECTADQMKRVNTICRKYNKKFFAGDVFGTFGYTFADLVNHEFAEDVVQNKKIKVLDGVDAGKEKFEKITVTIKSFEKFVPFEKILDVKKLPKDTEIYYLMLILLNFREKHQRDPLPSDRSLNALRDEAKKVIEKYSLGEKLDHLLNGDLYAQISPVCAIVGGVMGQEIIKTVSQKERPHNNLFVFNPDTLCGQVLRLS